MNSGSINARIIPSMFSLGNLFFGFLAILGTLDGNYKLAAGWIILAVLLDSMDGKVARKLDASSEFGRELDSLCDVVSFGVAPAILTYQVFLKGHLGYLGVFIAAFFALSGAVRLARFNVMNISTYFIGVPITFAGGFMSLLILFHNRIPWFIFPIAMVVLGVLMVSTFKVPKLGK